VPANAVFGDIVDVLADRKISEVPVVDQNNCPVGLIDITDVIGWLPTSGCD
ncbi:MAG: CBS domain-containing protein, partial [Planctomycetaceae bacterium]|nr:CBS domain-containing protein [Planctomycetaceae bacterium]